MKANTVLIALVCAVGPAMSSDAERAESVTLEYVAHACFRITSPSGQTVMIDPFRSRWWLGYDFPRDLGPLDAVLITHPHSDHDGGLRAGHSVPWDEDTPVYTDPGRVELGDVAIVGVRGKHADPYGKEFGQTNTIWLLEIAGLRIVHVGDNGPLTEAVAEKLGRVDILMLPIDSMYHILSREAIEAFRQKLSPSILIPIHYRHPDLEPRADKPDDLGGIDGWLKGQQNVRRLGTNVIETTRGKLPDEQEIVVFEHSPKLRGP